MFGFAKGRIDEDGLTAAVFGLMKYLADAEMLHPFLERLAKANTDFAWSQEQLPEAAVVVPWPTLEVPEHMGPRFAKIEDETKGSVTPDALVRLNWSKWGVEGRPRSVWIYVESEHSKAVEAEQLAQQWTVLQGMHAEDDEVWLLLLNKTPSLPWPEGGRPHLWPGAPKDLARRDLLTWCAVRAHYLRTGAGEPDPSKLPDGDWPRLLHFSWQATADLIRDLQRRSWAYGSLFAGASEYLESAGYSPAVGWLEAVELAEPSPIADRHGSIAGARPVLLASDPDILFAQHGGTFIGVQL